MVTMQPAIISTLKALNAAVPCMSGAAGTATGPGLVVRARSAWRSCSAPIGGFAVASSTPKMSSWRHMTPLGMPVVPPV